MYDSCWKSPNHDAWRDALFEKVFLISWEWRSLLNEHAILKLLCTDKNLWLVYQSRIFIQTFSIPGGLAKVPQINICTYIYTSPPLFLNKTLYKKVLLHEYSGIISSCLDINIIKKCWHDCRIIHEVQSYSGGKFQNIFIHKTKALKYRPWLECMDALTYFAV